MRERAYNVVPAWSKYVVSEMVRRYLSEAPQGQTYLRAVDILCVEPPRYRHYTCRGDSSPYSWQGLSTSAETVSVTRVEFRPLIALWTCRVMFAGPSLRFESQKYD